MQYPTYMQQPAAPSMPMPFQTSTSGAYGQSVGAFTQSAGTFGQSAGAYGQSVGSFSPSAFSQPQLQTYSPAQFMSPPSMSAPTTPKIVQSSVASMGADTAKVIASALGTSNPPTYTSPATATYANSISSVPKAGVSSREQALEAKARELESTLLAKDRQIQQLEAELASVKPNSKPQGKGQSSPGRKSNFRNTSESKPTIRYVPGDPDDAIDVRLAEHYNSTNSAIQFKRINKGFYRFGETIVELDIVNHKLMARTEDGWNRGKLANIEKFMTQYENIEREKMGILPEC